MYLFLRVDQRLKQNHEDVLLPTHLQKLYLSVKDLGLILGQKIIPIDHPVSKKFNSLLRDGSPLREDDGAIEFWRTKDYLQNHFVHSRHWSDEKWKSTMAKGGGNKKRFQK